MNTIAYRLAICLFVVLAWGCNRNRVTVTEFEPQGEVQELQSFTVEFSEDLAPSDQLDEWLTEPYLEFNPPVEGRFKWLTARTLLFSPDRALLPSQSYQVSVNKKAVLAHTDKGGNFGTYEFHTPFFEAKNVEFFWQQIPKQDHRVSIQANLSFNYAVDPNEVTKYLRIQKGTQVISHYTVETREPANVIALNLGELAQTEEAQTFEVELKQGLTPVINRGGLKEPAEFSFTLPGITQLAVISAHSGFNNNENGYVEVHTTQAVDPDQLARYVEVSPKPARYELSATGNHIRIDGNLPAGTQVKLTLKEGLPGLYGGTLKETYEEDVILADLEPDLRFADRTGTYLLRDGLQNLRVEATNVPKARLEVYEVFKNNLLFFFYNNYDYSNLYYNHSNEAYDDRQNYYVNYYGKQLYEEKLTFEAVRNRRQSTVVNLKQALNQRFKGVYVVQVSSEEDYWRRDAKLVAISDLGLIAKYSGDDLLVFANSLRTAEPVEGVEIQLISENNQTLASGQTDAQGFLRIQGLDKQVEGFTPRLLTAELGEDFNFLDLEATRTETSRFDLGGKFVAQDSYDCFVYGDRNLYRPGETVYLSAILREPDMQVVTGIPVGVKILSPQGKVFSEYQKTVNEQGAFELAVPMPDFVQTGQYIAEFYTGSDDLLASYRFSIEDFAPDKIRVELEQDKQALNPGESIDIDIDADYLFGAPAANHRYEMDVRLDHRAYQSEAHPEFDFSNYSTEDTYLENEFSEASLNEAGEATATYVLPTGIQSGGYVQGRAFVSVFDVTGRTVNRTTSFKAYPKNYFPGIRAKGYYYGTNKDIRFDLIAVNAEDEAIKGFEAEVELIRYEWATVLERNTYNGRYRYQSVQKEISEWKKSVSLSGGPTPYTFQVSRSGRYELRLSKRGSKEYVKQRFYAYRWGSATASSFEVNKEGQVEIILDKESYQPGETAKALVVTPFTGKMLLTLEREQVMKHWYVDITENSTELPIDLGDEHVPNVYISATLFRPHNAEDNVPFLVGHGYASVEVVNPSRKLEVSIEAPEKIKPRRTQNVTVKAGANETVFVTLAAVDEGILQVKNFQTPDPYAHMYAKRGLGVQSYDLYKYLLPEVAASSPAGGDEFSSGRRLNPVKGERFKLLAQWSGIRRTNGRGEVTIPIEIPQFNGEVRLMAVAYKGTRFGSASKAMTVADDLILMPSIPRFLSMQDSLLVPVTVVNTTEKSGEATVRMNVDGPVEVTGSKFESVKLGPNETGQVQFVVQTGPAIGTANITFSSTGFDKVLEEIELPIRPISPLVMESETGSIEAGGKATVQIPDDFIPSTQETRITLSTMPAMQHAHHLRRLLGYPYGCVEQIASKLFPQLYFNELAAQVAPDMFVRGNPVYYLKEGIHKLQGMARYDGSFAYWPGGNEVNWWGSVYATHFLLEAREAGYVVNEDVLQNALTYLNRRAADRETFEYVYYTGGQRQQTTIAKKEVLYSLYVLALAGKPDLSLMNFYRSRPKLLSGDTRYLLAGAFALAKNYNAYNDLLPQGFQAERAQRESGGSFDSEARANAIMLNVLLDVDPSNPNIPAMVRHLSGLGDKIWSTQDRAWTFLALGKAANKQAQSDVQVEVAAAGKLLATLSKASPGFESEELNGKRLDLTAKGTGQTFYFWKSDGIKAQGGMESVDQNMRVRRTYLNRNGQEISSFRQGDLIVCRISLTGGERSVENIAVTDMVPAGFEIENPRLTGSADLAWVGQVKNRFTPDYLDVRDDRLVLFTDLERQQTRHYHYLLRVVNRGTFQLPAIGAEAMYDPDYRSYHGAGVVRVP